MNVRLTKMKDMIPRLKCMPRDLAVMSVMLFVFGLVIIAAAILRGDRFRIGGYYPTYAEFWYSGGGVVVLLTGFAMLVVSWGIFHAHRWIRYGIPTGLLVATFWSLWDPTERQTGDWMGFLAWAVISIWYLFGLRTVREYFRKKTSPNQRSQATV